MKVLCITLWFMFLGFSVAMLGLVAYVIIEQPRALVLNVLLALGSIVIVRDVISTARNHPWKKERGSQ